MLDPSWHQISLPGRPWVAQERQGALPDAPGRVLGGSWGPLVAKRCFKRPQGCKNGVKSLQNYPKIDAKKL